MKSTFQKSKGRFFKLKNLMLTGVLVFSISCSDQEDEILLNGDVDTGLTSQKVAPVIGGIYTITCVKNGRTLDIANKSNSNGANLQVWGTNSNTGSTHRQWEIISTDGDYVRLKGVDSGKCLEVSGGSNVNKANVQQWTYQATTHQQWEILSVGSDNYRLKNRDSGKSLRVGGTANGTNADQYSYKGWSSQKFYFTQVGEAPGEEEESGGLISTIDGSFDLNDFVIESSSHNSSSDDTSTDSWPYNNHDLSSSWYRLSGGDYYLTCDKYEGKRTEWKEDSGYERSLSTSKVMKYEASLTNIPGDGVTVAQMHNRYSSGSEKSRRPLLRVYIEDGKIRVKKTNNDLTNTSGSYDSEVVGPSYSEGSKFKVQLTTGSGKVNVKIETSSGTLDQDFSPYTGGNYSDYDDKFYFKAGVYTEGHDVSPTMRFYSFEN